MHRCIIALLRCRTGFFFSSPAISSLQAVNFGPGRSNPRTKSRTKSRVAAALLAGLCLGAFSARAQTWSGAFDNTWNDARNWVPNAVPNSPTAVASFTSSTQLNPLLGFPVSSIGEIRFEVGAPNYTITVSGVNFQLRAFGINNLSGTTQTIMIGQSVTSFRGSSTADDATFTNSGGINFQDSSTAGNAKIINNHGGITSFFGNSSGGKQQRDSGGYDRQS